MAEPDPQPRPQAPSPGPSRFRLGALRHRNYRLFFAGQIVSLVGTWMQSIAQPWLVLQMTHNAFYVGLTLAIQFTPILLLGQFGGLIADRFPKRRILLVTQALFPLPAFALFLATDHHAVQLWMVMVAAACVGTINVFDVPARQAFVIEMVGREDLMNAIALNSSIFNASSVIGPSVAGIVIAAVGLPICFLANSLSYLAAVTALLLMRNLPRVARKWDGTEADRPLTRIRQGISYAVHDPVVGMMLLAVAVFSLFAMNRLTLMPLFADQVLHVGARGFGFLMAALGIGALAGALSLAFMGERWTNGRRQFWVGLTWVVLLIGFSLSHWFYVSLVLLLGAGFCQMSFIAIANTRIQTATPDHLRGRVMALYAQAMMGTGPLGSTQAGALAFAFGPPVAMITGSIVAGSVLAAIRLARPVVFLGRPRPKPVSG